MRAYIAERKKEAEELAAVIEDKIARKRRAEKLIRSLHSEKQKWVVCQRMIELNSKSVGGDVVLSACIVNYGGGFSFSYRRQLIEKIQD